MVNAAVKRRILLNPATFGWSLFGGIVLVVVGGFLVPVSLALLVDERDLVEVTGRVVGVERFQSGKWHRPNLRFRLAGQRQAFEVARIDRGHLDVDSLLRDSPTEVNLLVRREELASGDLHVEIFQFRAASRTYMAASDYIAPTRRLTIGIGVAGCVFVLAGLWLPWFAWRRSTLLVDR